MLTATKPNRCKHCKARMPEDKARHVLHDECMQPWIDRQLKKQADARARKQRAEAKIERAEIRRRKNAIKTIPKLIAAAQEAFNAYIRERDREKGCFVCHRPFLPDVPGRALHAGHVRSRGAAGHLRFHEDNCLGECEGCNGPRGAKPHQIKAGAVERIGLAAFEALEADNTPIKWDRETLEQIKGTYRAKLRQLKKEAA